MGSPTSIVSTCRIYRLVSKIPTRNPIVIITSSHVLPFSYLLAASPNGRLYLQKLEECILRNVPELNQNKLLRICL